MALLPLMAVVLVVFLITGLAIPVLPLHVHQGLGLGTFVVGLVTGAQFAVSLVSPVWSGHYADRRGANRAVVAGLLAAAVSGLLYILSLQFIAAPLTSDTAARPRIARWGGELYRHGGAELGPGSRGRTEFRQGHSLDWDGDVRSFCRRCTGWNRSLRNAWVFGYRAGDDHRPACDIAVDHATSPRRTASSSPTAARHGGRCCVAPRNRAVS
jgi:hypothetical protein